MIEQAADIAVDVLVIAVAIVAVIFAVGMIFKLIGNTLIFIGEVFGGGKDRDE